MIERQSVLLLSLLLDAQVFEILGKLGGTALQFLQIRGERVGFAPGGVYLDAQLAQLALQRQRTAARLPPAGHRVAVIADAVRKQEVTIRMRIREALGMGTIEGQIATLQAR